MRSRADSDIMFVHGGYLSDKLAEMRGAMLAEIDRIAENALLNTPVDDFVSRLSSAYTCTPVALRRDEVSVSEQEISVPIDEVPDGYFRYSEETTHVPGHRYSFHVPFTGDAWLFRMHGSLVSFNLPRATIVGDELVFSYSTTSAEDVPRAKQSFEQNLRMVDELIRNSTMLVEQHNAKLATDARTALEKRRARVLQAKNLVTGLGYPLKKRVDAVQTYAAPPVRKQIVPSRATPTTTSSAPFRPEPVLVGSEYEDILSTIQSMALVMERSPHAFKTLGEEEIRTHFLMLLNGIYEGAATGETFNFNGKTDTDPR